MASAVLTTRNEPYWGERKVYMRKYTNTANAAVNVNSNPFLKFDPGPDPNPTPKPVSRRYKQIESHDLSSNPHFRQNELSVLPATSSSPYRNSMSFQEAKEFRHDGYVTFNLGAYTRRDLIELKRRLVSELEQVRALKTRLEILNCETRPIYPPSHDSIFQPPPLQFNNLGPNRPKAKQQNRTPKASQTKKKGPVQCTKRSNPLSEDPNPKRLATDPLMEKVLSSMMKRCSQILTKLMKQRVAWIFNKPVNVVELGLFDYHQIIKKPMDLGTVKSNLDKNDYKSPMDFAADVMITFDNAMIYNPKEHRVHRMAQHLLSKFNEMFNPAYKKFEDEQARIFGLSHNLPQPQPALVHPLPVESIPMVEKPVSFVEKTVQLVMEPPKVGKLPKPKAKDPNKREMSFEEKAKLGKELEQLPQEKMAQLLQIVKKRNEHYAQDEDEIELDMMVMDTETLWELDRFVTNCKKMASKIRRQVLMQNQMTPGQTNQSPVGEMVDVGQKAGEEDLDVGEEIPVGSYPSVEIEKEVTGCASGGSSSFSSSSSGSDSSSSSDSGSSSGSDSDADTVQSPYVESNQVQVI